MGFAVSASGSELGGLNLVDVAFVSRGGQHVEGPRPSVETELHRVCYELRPAAGAVLHCQSPSATVLACLKEPPTNLDFIPEIPAYVRRFAHIGYHAPGSAALVAAIRGALADPEVTIVQMGNHGQLILGSTWEKVIRRAGFFELAAWMFLKGGEMRTIPEHEAAALRSADRDV